jgi:hypothetical protein
MPKDSTRSPDYHFYIWCSFPELPHSGLPCYNEPPCLRASVVNSLSPPQDEEFWEIVNHAYQKQGSRQVDQSSLRCFVPIQKDGKNCIWIYLLESVIQQSLHIQSSSWRRITIEECHFWRKQVSNNALQVFARDIEKNTLLQMLQFSQLFASKWIQTASVCTTK